MNYLDYVEAAARAVPDRVAVREGDDAWTYADLLADAYAAANALAAEGVGAGDAVLVSLPNSYGFVTATLGALARRATVAPVNTRFGRREVSHLVELVDPDAAVACAETHSLVAAAMADCGRADAPTYTTDGEGDAPTWGDAVADAGSDYRVPETLGERTAFVLHTSGSTGRPKAVVHTHANLTAVSDAAVASYELAPDSVFLAVVPLYHCTGIGTVLGPTLKAGGELLLREKWDPDRALDAVERHGVTVFSGVPTMFKDWLALAADRDVDASSMETGVVGGAGVTADLVRRAESLLGCPVLNGWGMTETFAAGLWEDRRGERRLPSVGRPSGRLFEARVVDPETGAACDPGEAGELLVRGESTMTGYLDREAEWTGEWLHTGDYARVEDGHVHVFDRVDYTIITGGENVYPQEVEGVIEELDGVREAAVVGKPDERKGAKPVAFVDRLDGDLTAERVKSHVLAELAPFKHPREVTFVEGLPRNAVGKVDREALADRV